MALNFLNNGAFTGKLNVETTGISNTAIFENSGQSFSYTAIKVGEALGNRANLTFVVGDNLAATDLIGEIGCLITSDGGALEGAMSFKTNSGDTLTERMVISSAGALRFNAYGAGTLITDASGNITVSSGGGAGGPYLPLTGGTLSGNLTVSIPDTGSTPATTAIMALLGYEGRGAGIKIRDSVNSATSPSNREWFVGTGYSTSSFNIGYAANGSQSSYAANTKFLVTTAGEVGIGTTSPGAELDVKGTLIVDGGTGVGSTGVLHVRQDGDGVSNGITITSSISSSHRIWKDAIGNLNLTNSGGAGVSINGSGDVGIGTTSPGAKLDIVDSNLATMFRLSNTTLNSNAKYGSIVGRHYTNSEQNVTGMLITSGSPSTGNIISIGGGISSCNAASDILFYTAVNGTTLNGTQRMVIDQDGDVGIGATNPTFKLDIGTNLNSNNVFRINGYHSRVLLSGTVNAPTNGVGMWNFINHAGTNSLTRFYVQDANNVDARLTFRFTGNGGSNEILSGSSTGNVGIGTTSPSAKLDVSVASGNAWMNLINGSETAFRLTTYNNGTGSGSSAYAFKHGLYYNTTENAAVTFYRGDSSTGGFLTFTTNNGSERMRIDSAGNVGIGTTTTVTDNRLKVIGGSDYQTLNIGESQLNNTIKRSGLTATHYTVAEQDISMMSVFSSSTSTAISIGGSAGTLNAAMEIRFYTASNTTTTTGTQRMVISSSGNVGIGTNDPQSKLHVSGGTSIQTTLTIGASGTGTDKSSKLFFNEGEGGVTNSKDYGFSLAYDGQGSQYPGLAANEFGIIRHNDSANGDVVMKIARTSDNVIFNGKVGINETNPFYQLDVDGTIRATGDVIAYSDARVKENVVTIDNALDKVTRLRGVTYTRKDIENKKTKMGVIAQEVLEVVPEVVHKDDDGMYAVAYGNMNGLLIEAIKELKAEIEELKSRL